MSKKSRWLLQTLILSGALNLAFLGLFFYFLIRDNPLNFSYIPKEEIQIEKTALNPAFLGRLHALSFDHLVELLEDTRSAEQGLSVREFAVAALATFYDFDVPRALHRQSLPQRHWEFDETTFILYSALTDDDFEHIRIFAKTERYPYTSKGLFARLEVREAALVGYFCHTPQFLVFETLFGRTQAPILRGTLLTMVCEGGWERFEAFTQAQELRADFSDEQRREVLLDYIEGGSKTAAHLLLTTDREYALGQLSDQQLSRVLDLFDEKTDLVVQFVEEILASPRGEDVRECAQRHIEKELRPVFRDRPPAAPEPSLHIIQPGESLWLIAKKYGVSIELLQQVNGLPSTVIQPGKTLKIP